VRWSRPPAATSQDYLLALPVVADLQLEREEQLPLLRLGEINYEQGPTPCAESRAPGVRDSTLRPVPVGAANLDNIGSVRFQQGDLGGAKDAVVDALAIFRVVGDRGSEAVACFNVAVAVADGEGGRSRRFAALGRRAGGADEPRRWRRCDRSSLSSSR
jgi:hypothetical protein